jgi:hypothetical protein
LYDVVHLRANEAEELAWLDGRDIF